MNFVLAFIAFNVIVIVHELGHFLFAKKFGIKVEEFSLFLGPKLYSFQRGETTYSLRLFPIVAYVKMEGEEQPSESERAYNNKPKYARALTAFGGPLANFILALVLMTAFFAIQGFSTNEIAQVEKGSPAEYAGLQKGDAITRYDGNRVLTPNELMQFLYVSKDKTVNIEYTRNGESYSGEITPSKLPESKKYRIGVTFVPDEGNGSNVIDSITPGYPAEKVGLMAGDRIIKIGDVNVSNRDDLLNFLEKNKDKEVSITALRSNSEVNVNLIPKTDKDPEQYILGIGFLAKKGNILDSIGESAVFTYSTIRSVGYSLIWLIKGVVSANQLVGPVGMVSAVGTAVQQGPDLMTKFIVLLYYTSFLSIAIGATNLIPFPMLDGNRIVLIGIEAIRRKPIKPEREAFISMVGFVLIILLAIYAFYNDIVRLINGFS